MFNILWIDDEPRNLIYEQQLINDVCKSYDPETPVSLKFATDIDNAIKALTSEQFCLILLDLHLIPPKGESANIIIQHQTGYSLYRFIIDIENVTKRTNEFTPDYIFNKLNSPLSEIQKKNLSSNSDVEIVVISGNKVKTPEDQSETNINHNQFDDFLLYKDIDAGKVTKIDKPIEEDQLKEVIITALEKAKFNDN